MTRLASIDIGNDSVKAILGDVAGGNRATPLPNVIAETSENRGVVSLESNVYEGSIVE